MIREIKFRVWDKNKRCFPVEGEIYLIDVIKGYRKNLIAEQYTGLKDKNGKEIYEGDIVRLYGHYVSEITWQDNYCGFRWYNEEDGYCGLGKENEEYYEVIGNVHENKDFKEVKNEIRRCN